MSDTVQSFIILFVGISLLLFVVNYITGDSRRLDLQARNDIREFGGKVADLDKTPSSKHRQE